MSTRVSFWVDPICPWCWVTSQWMRRVAVQRDLEVTWQPISLLLKNAPDPSASHYESLAWTYGLLKVMESVRAAEGDDPIGGLYKEYGRRIHHEKERMFDAAVALSAVGLDTRHAAAAADPAWDDAVRERHDHGLSLVGNDVGTPIISIREVAADGTEGEEKAIFGPVISRVPPADDAARLWDSLVFLNGLDVFFELKRSRTGRPDVGEAP